MRQEVITDFSEKSPADDDFIVSGSFLLVLIIHKIQINNAIIDINLLYNDK